MTAIDPRELRKAMDTAGVTPTQLARLVDHSPSYLCEIAAGRRRLKRNPILRRRIADALGVPRRSIETEAS